MKVELIQGPIVPFNALRSGDFFISINGTHAIKTENYQGRNAVNLESGIFCSFDVTEGVFAPNAKVVINHG